MNKTRVEAFSDGVLAIIITIMVLELKVPQGTSLATLLPLWPTLLSYALSFVNIGIYWNNHHHFLHGVEHVDGKVMWANLHLLFWLSLVPVATGWMGVNHFAAMPIATYAFILFMTALAWQPFHHAVVKANPGSVLDRTVGEREWKSIAPLLMYGAAIPLAFVSTWLSGALIVGVAVMWFIPERRIEEKIQAQEPG